VLLHVCPGQFDADGETLHDEDYARELQGDEINISPGAGVNQVRGMWPENDTAKRGDSSFTDVEALLDYRGAQHEQAREATQDQVDQVRLGNGKVVPRHLGGR
jgi:hypothetical protein